MSHWLLKDLLCLCAARTVGPVRGRRSPNLQLPLHDGLALPDRIHRLPRPGVCHGTHTASRQVGADSIQCNLS